MGEFAAISVRLHGPEVAHCIQLMSLEGQQPLLSCTIIFAFDETIDKAGECAVPW